MKRRDFLKTGGLAVTIAASARPADAQPGTPAGERHVVGDFILLLRDGNLEVRHSRDPDRVIWDGAPGGNFLVAEQATATTKAFGSPEGAYEIVDAVSAIYDDAMIEAVTTTPGKAGMTGTLTGDAGTIRFTLTFEAVSASSLRFTAGVEGDGASSVSRIRLVGGSAPEEAFFGFGHQLTYFNQKGFLLPILVQEHGVGRGRAVVTQIVDVFANRGGGDPHLTESPAPHFISSRLRSLFLENTEYSTFDMRHADRIDIKVWSTTMTGRILYGESPLDLIEAYTDYAGRMRALPDWIQEGVVVSVQGGTDIVRSKLDALNAADIPVAGLWIQDWPGVRVTSAGKQLWWDWKLDETLYPGWKDLVADVERQGGRMLLYINPFLSTEEGHDALFTEGRRKGFLVKRQDGTPYLIRNTNFSAALVDLANPEARIWIKSIIKTEMIEKAGASGWMNDFGEALPFDGKLHENADPMVWHNRYPEEWARVSREAIEEVGRGGDIVFFDRSGFTQSPGAATLFWLGDQIQSWDEYDGIKTAVVGLLSGGVSGFSLLHSDTGGYVVLKLDLHDRQIPVLARTPELLMRWMELNAFTAVFRTHEGLDPAASAQFDTNADTLAHLERFGKIYKGLAPYRKGLVAEAARRGHPVVRHLFLHYPDDANTFGLRYQFLLGPDLMVAPVLTKGADTVDVYFPKESTWIDLWTGAEVGRPGEWMRMPAPLSKPAAFLLKGAESVEAIRAGLRSVGILES